MKGFFTGFRKLFMAVLFLVTAVVLLAIGLVPQEDWMKQVATVMTAFMATNVGEHIINVGKEWIQNRKWENMKDVIGEAQKR